MGLINQHNYEEYILDFLEGTLEKSLHLAMLDFLEAHPEIKEELQNLEDIVLTPENDIFQNKEKLKNIIQPVGFIHEENFEHYIIAFYEGDLSTKEKETVALFMKKNPFLKKDFELIRKARLKPDFSIIYPEKAALKKSTKPITLWWVGTAAALLIAAIALFSIVQNPAKPGISKLNEPQAHTVTRPAQTVASTKSQPLKTNHTRKQKKGMEKVQKPENSIKTDHKQKNALQSVAQSHFPVQTAVAPLKQLTVSLVSQNSYERIRVKHLLKEKGEFKNRTKNSRTVAGKLIAGLMNKAKKELPAQNMKFEPLSKEPAMVKIMDRSVQLFSAITGSEPAEMEKFYDSNGNLIAYKVSGGSFNFRKKISNSLRSN